MDTVLHAEPLIRLSVFAGVFALLAAWEALAPRRTQAIGRAWRWPNNLGVVVVDTLVLRALFPTAAVGFALVCEGHGWGALNTISLPLWAKCLVAVLALDLVLYAQHVAFHAVPVLWRLHRMHHADLEFDVTTGVRFHPVEIVLSMLIKFDYGDDWRFVVEVIGRGEREPKVRYPRVLRKVGRSPEQYPDWDDEAEEYRAEEEDGPERLD